MLKYFLHNQKPSNWNHTAEGQIRSIFAFLFVKRRLSNLNMMSLVAVKKRKSGKNRKDRNKVDRKVRKKGKFPV